MEKKKYKIKSRTPLDIKMNRIIGDKIKEARANREVFIHVPQTSTTASHTIKRQKECTQTELAKAIGVTFQQIQKYEKGANGTSTIRLIQISEFFNKPLTYFTSGVKELIGQVKPPINNSSTIAPSLVANKEELNMSV
jgi:DNA-binding XRE family transcriptional regulator|nr:transcription regulator [uncultured Mediterranean phage uvMED]|tara:strand:+ start:484 stop:897 length:414 start_codon:yes stop_codon:yes gene_type:complete